jgi:hypothetical protein
MFLAGPGAAGAAAAGAAAHGSLQARGAGDHQHTRKASKNNMLFLVIIVT